MSVPSSTEVSSAVPSRRNVHSNSATASRRRQPPPDAHLGKQPIPETRGGLYLLPMPLDVRF